MADSYSIINNQVVPYIGGRMNTDTESWRDLTDLEVEQQERITQLETALNNLLNVAYNCDGWSSFPAQALEDAENALQNQ